MLRKASKFPQSKGAMPSFREAFRQHVIPPFIPPVPIFSQVDAIVTQGSCFAGNIAKALVGQGINARWLEVDEVMNSPLANRTYLEYLLAGKPLLNPNHSRALHKMFDTVEHFESYRSSIINASGFVFTAGVAYSWIGDDGIHLIQFKRTPVPWVLASPGENREHIKAIIEMIRAVNPTIKTIMTVSPIPLIRAPDEGSVFVADCLSKSSLRLAVQQVLSLRLTDVYYWPSFEGIKWLSGHFGPMFGVEGEDERHIGKSFLDEVLKPFVEHFFK